jgi:hypothetical protein
MAYSLGTNKNLTTASSPVVAAPLTIAAWFYNPASTDGNIFGVLDLLNSHGFFMYVGSDNRLSGFIKDVSGTTTWPATTSTSANTWSHACAVFTNTTSRTIYLNGGSSATNTSNRTGATPTKVVIGSISFSVARAAECGIWNAALTAAEIASLAKGMTCDKIRPQNLVFYAPLVRDLIDQKGGLTITNNNGATVAAHPRVYA